MACPLILPAVPLRFPGFLSCTFGRLNLYIILYILNLYVLQDKNIQVYNIQDNKQVKPPNVQDKILRIHKKIRSTHIVPLLIKHYVDPDFDICELIPQAVDLKGIIVLMYRITNRINLLESINQILIPGGIFINIQDNKQDNSLRIHKPNIDPGGIFINIQDNKQDNSLRIHKVNYFQF
jgi:hypothetical protein